MACLSLSLLIFYAKDYAWERNVAIFLLSLLVIIGILGSLAYWAYKKQTSSGKELWKQKQFPMAVLQSIMIIALAFILFSLLVLGVGGTI